MIKSMTGYGRCSETVEGYDITFEIKSVNNRFLDTNIRIPRTYGYLEEKIKKMISQSVSRGKVDAFLTIEKFSDSEETVLLDEGLVDQYVSIIRSIGTKYDIPDGLTASAIAKFPDVFKKRTTEENEEKIWGIVSKVVEKALSAFVEMRKIEGENLYRDLSSRLDTLSEIRNKILTYSEEAIVQYKNRLEEKIKEYVGDLGMDEGRILTEVGIMADKIDTGEELTRLESHIAQFRSLLKKDSPSGRNLDFLTQELNREVNTTGSKCSMIEITSLVIEAKNEIERIREQIQNIE